MLVGSAVDKLLLLQLYYHAISSFRYQRTQDVLLTMRKLNQSL